MALFSFPGPTLGRNGVRFAKKHLGKYAKMDLRKWRPLAVLTPFLDVLMRSLSKLRFNLPDLAEKISEIDQKLAESLA